MGRDMPSGLLNLQEAYRKDDQIQLAIFVVNRLRGLGIPGPVKRLTGETVDDYV
jgi:hypothetical protein